MDDDTYGSRNSLSLAETYITDSSTSFSSNSIDEPQYHQRRTERHHREKNRKNHRENWEGEEFVSIRDYLAQDSDSEESVYYEIVDSDEEESEEEGNYNDFDQSWREETKQLLDPFEYVDTTEAESIMDRRPIMDRKIKKSDDTIITEATMTAKEPQAEEEDANEEKDAVNIFALPSSIELSKELCKLVVGFRKDVSYSEFRRSALQSLVNISGWVETRDPTFLKHFLTYGGVVKVVDFLQEVLREEEGHAQDQDREGDFLRYRIAVECIRLGASIISGVCSLHEEQEDDINSSTEDVSNHSRTRSLVSVSSRFLAGVTGTVIVDHGGIEILLLASDLCRRSRNKCKNSKEECIFANNKKEYVDPSLEASEKVWKAIVTACSCVGDETTTVLIEKLLVFLWDTGFEVLETFPHDTSSVACPKTNDVTFLLRASVFRVFTRVLVRIRNDFQQKKKSLEDEDILSRALEVLSGKYKSHDDDEATFATGISSISMSFRISGAVSGSKEEEAYVEEALLFFVECQSQGILFQTKSKNIVASTPSEVSQISLDLLDEQWKRLCEDIVPLCVNGLQKFSVENASIRKTAIRLLDACLCSINKNTEQQNLLTELTDGTLEALGPCLASESLDDTEKYEIKEVVRKIAVVIYSVYIGEFGPSGICQEL